MTKPLAQTTFAARLVGMSTIAKAFILNVGLVLSACAQGPVTTSPEKAPKPPPSPPATTAATPVSAAPPPSSTATPPVSPKRSVELQKAIDALPVVARLEALAPTPFVLRGRLSPQRAKIAKRIARGLIEDVVRRFVGNKPDPSLTPVDVCLFESDKSYSSFNAKAGKADTMMGFYSRRKRLVVVNLKRSVGNLRHELLHALIGDHFPACPRWLNEGLGSLYGTVRITPKGIAFVVNYRLRHVRQAMRRGKLPTLARMAASTVDDVSGPERMTYYGTARYLLLYMEASGQLGDFYREMRAKGPTTRPTTQEQLALLERYVDYEQFLAWTKRLRMGRLPAKVQR